MSSDSRFTQTFRVLAALVLVIVDVFSILAGEN